MQDERAIRLQCHGGFQTFGIQAMSDFSQHEDCSTKNMVVKKGKTLDNGKEEPTRLGSSIFSATDFE